MKIALIGYGRMGHEIERQALMRGHDIVSRIDVENRCEIDSDAFRSAEVAIEFTSPAAAFDNCMAALQQNVAVVSGSTGWLQRLPELQTYCRQHPEAALLQSTNFSIGMNIFMRLNRALAQLTAPFDGYAPSMEETHHIHKQDHPPGTAITLAEDLLHERRELKQWSLTSLTLPDGEVQRLSHPATDTLPIASVRRGEVPGIHTVKWDSEADEISITHSAHSRTGFALGAVMAAEWLPAHPGFRTTTDFMDYIFANPLAHNR